MRNIAFLLLLFFGHCVSAQKPAHLDAVAVTKMVPVDSIDNQDTKPNSCSGWVDTNIRFTACLNAEGIVKRKRYKSGNYYRVYMDTLCFGYNAKGRMLYAETTQYLGWIDRAYMSQIPNINTMIAAITRDLSTRGRDFAKYGGIRWTEKLGDRYVLAVVFNPPVNADALILYYTFDRNGPIEGVTLENWW